MDQKAQSAFEYLLSYSWAILIISIAVGLLLYFVSAPSKTVQDTCNFTSGFLCTDVNIGTTSNGETSLTINLTNVLDYPLSAPSMIVNYNGKNTTSVTCTIGASGSIVVPGNSTTCTTTLPVTTSLDQFESGGIFVNAGNCALTSNYLSLKTCTDPPTQTFTGTFEGHTETPAYGLYYIAANEICIGIQGVTPSNTYYANIITGGGIGAWIKSSSIPTTAAGVEGECQYYKNYIYCAGIDSSGDSYYAHVLRSGGTGTWMGTTAYPSPGLEYTGCVIYGGYMYCIGGLSNNNKNVYYAPVSSTGIGTWVATTSYPTYQDGVGCNTYKNEIYCVGQNVVSGYNQEYYATIISSGGIGAWTYTGNYPVARSLNGGSCSVSNNIIYCNADSTPEVYFAPISSTGIGTWIAGNSPSASIGGVGCSVVGGYYYCVGSDGTPYNAVQYAQILPSGGVGTFTTSTNSFPTGGSGFMYDDFCVVPNSGST